MVNIRDEIRASSSTILTRRKKEKVGADHVLLLMIPKNRKEADKAVPEGQDPMCQSVRNVKQASMLPFSTRAMPKGNPYVIVGTHQSTSAQR